MGLEFVQITLDLEAALQIELNDKAIPALWENRSDIQVRDLVEIAETAVKLQKSTYDGSVFDLVRRLIAETTNIDESQITLDSWVFRDLQLG